MAKKHVQVITLYGNLGGDPKLHEIPEKTGTRPVYDPIIDEVLEKPVTYRARQFRTFRLAVNAKGLEEPRWHPCVDWTNESKLLRKGDRVKLTGHFEVRSYERDGETRRIRQFVVKSVSLERAKIRTSQAA